MFDSSWKIAETRSLFFAVLAGILSLILIGITAAFIIFICKNKIISKHSALYKSSPDFIVSTDTYSHEAYIKLADEMLYAPK